MKKQGIAYCGLDCDTCPAFIATLNNDDELKQKTAESWMREYSEYLGGKTLSAGDINCHGCRTEEETLFIGCSICPIRKCAKEKGVRTCAHCIEFELCGLITGFFWCHEQAKKNLANLQDTWTPND